VHYVDIPEIVLRVPCPNLCEGKATCSYLIKPGELPKDEEEVCLPAPKEENDDDKRLIETTTSMTWPNDFVNKIVCSDCVTAMSQIPDNSVDITITSPVYDNLRSLQRICIRL